MFPDPLVAIRTLLLTDTEVAALVDSRVFVAELPGGETPHMPRAAVVLSEAGGRGSRGFARIGDTRVDVRSYGGDLVQSWQVHAAVHEVLKQLRRSRVGEALVYTVTVEGGPLRLREPQVEWPLVLRTYQVTAAELVAA